MNIARREFLLGGLMVGALGTAEFLRPRREIDLMGKLSLEEIVPETLGPWQSVNDASLIQPVQEGSLMDTLYDGLLTRRYVNQQTDDQIMVLMAYGRSQTDSLQLHRPEVCYPAVGIPIIAQANTEITFGTKSIPAVQLVAQSPSRTEDIIYWSRMGEEFPQTSSSQRAVKLKLAMRGYIPDGILVRVSQLRAGGEPDYTQIKAFIQDMLTGVKPAERAPLIGTVSQ